MVAAHDDDCKQTNSPAAIVLTGGQSRRMGREKHLLPFGHELLLERICRLLSPVAAPIVVVAALEQNLPDLPAGVMIARDEFPGEGPLGGIVTGMKLLHDMHDMHESRVGAAWVCSCDAPFVNRDVIRFLHRDMRDFEAITIRFEGRVIPLGAIYQTSLEPQLRELFLNGTRRASAITDAVRTRFVDAEQLRAFDSDLLCLRNVNTPEEYAAARALLNPT